jgi:hypothetical protein
MTFQYPSAFQGTYPARYPFAETSAETDRDIPEMRKAPLEAITWGTLDRHESPARFKRIKDEILLIRD